MPSSVRYSMNGEYAVFTRMKEKGISLAAFATTILFLVLTVIMVSVTLQSSYAWLVMGSTLFLFLTLCSYSSCEKTHGSRWRRASMQSDSISTISEGRDNIAAMEQNRSNLPFWITDLPPSYSAAVSQQDTRGVVTGRASPQPPPPAYSTVVDLSSRENNPPESPPQCNNSTTHTNTLAVSSLQTFCNYTNLLPGRGPSEQVHSPTVPNSAIRLLNPTGDLSDTYSLDGHLSQHEKINKITSDSSSVC